MRRRQTRRHPVAELLDPRLYWTVAYATPVSIAFPTVAGTFQQPLTGDFNDDGKLDVLSVASSQFSGGPDGFVYLALGNGDGTLQAPTLAVSAVFNTQAAVGDFNGDGHLDLALSDFGGSQLHVYAGIGNGTFAAVTNFATGSGPFMMIARDFNGDGLDDLVVTDRNDDNVEIRLGNATTLLGGASSFAAGDDPATIVAGDFNNDGHLDLLTGNQGTANNVTALAGQSDGTFAAPVVSLTVVGVVTTGDVNNDGKLDLSRGFADTGEALLYLGNGDLTFQPGAESSSGFGATLADTDGDGNLDVVFDRTNSANQATTLPGKGDGTFATAVTTTLPTGGFGTAADLNGDELPDLVFIGLADSGNSLVTALSTPTGPNLTPQFVTQPPAAVVGGASGKLSVRITNSGTDAFSGTVATRLLASTDTTVDANDAAFASLSRNLKLKPGKSAVVKLKFDYPDALTGGAYQVLGQLSVTSGSSQPVIDDTAVAATAVQIAPPFVDLSASLPAALAPGYKAGKGGKVTLEMDNAGNVAAKGVVAVALTLSTDTTPDTGDVSIGATTVKVNIAAGKSKKLKIPFKLAAGQQLGAYTLIATATSSDFTDTALSNNTAVAAETFVVD